MMFCSAIIVIRTIIARSNSSRASFWQGTSCFAFSPFNRWSSGRPVLNFSFGGMTTRKRMSRSYEMHYNQTYLTTDAGNYKRGKSCFVLFLHLIEGPLGDLFSIFLLESCLHTQVWLRKPHNTCISISEKHNIIYISFVNMERSNKATNYFN